MSLRDGGTCRGTGGSMHIYDMENNFQGGWALVAEQLPYAVGAARSIKLDAHLGTGEAEDRIAIVFVGEGGAQNGKGHPINVQSHSIIQSHSFIRFDLRLLHVVYTWIYTVRHWWCGKNHHTN